MKAKASIQIKPLGSDELKYLEYLGLSDHEVQTYQVMVDYQKPTTAQDIATKLMIYPNAVYRIFRSLETRGLVYRVSEKPIRYTASEKTKGYRVAYQQQKSELARLLSLTGAQAGDKTGEAVLNGRKVLYDEYVRRAQAAKSEIAVFAIGIAYSDQLYKTQADAIKRGVYIKHVVQKLKPSNYHIINKWQRLGVSVRHNNQHQGYHITIIDREVALVTFSDPTDTDERLTIVTENPTAVKLFQLQFDAIWNSAQKITP